MHERGRCSGGCLLADTFGMSAASCSRPPQPAQSLLKVYSLWRAVSGGRRISELTMNAACAPTCRTYTDSNSRAVVFKFGVRLDK